MGLNRKERRKVDKKLSKLDSKDRFEMLSFATQKATTKALIKVYPEVIQLGKETAYMYLYDEYLSGFNEIIDAKEKEEKILSLINFIGSENLKATEKRLAEQKRVADVQDELKTQESEKQNGEV